MDLGFLVNIATIFSILATFAFSLREVLRERITLRQQARAGEDAGLRFAPDGIAEGGLLLRDARLVTSETADGQLTLSVTFVPASEAHAEAPAEADGMPKDIAVMNVTGQPFDVQSELAGARQTAGDEDAGFYRTRRPMTGWPRDAAVDTYKWGRLTAGAAARALWLLLLPFQLANVAMWQRLPSGRRSSAAVRALCRLFALSLTGSFVVTMVGIALDLVAFQCTVNEPERRCTAGRAWLEPFASGPLATPGRRLAVLALVPILAILIIWELARRTWHRYESYPVPEVQSGGTGLAHPQFWRNWTIVGRLRAIHVTAALATLDLFIVGTLAPHDRSPSGVGLTAACIAVLGACVIAVCLRPVFANEPELRWPGRAIVMLRTIALALTAATLWYAFWLDVGKWTPGPGLPGFDRTSVWLFVGQLALLVVLTVAIAVQHPPSATFGFGAVLFGAVGLGTAAAFSAALLYRIADFLSRAPNTDAAGLVQPTTAYQWAGLGFVVMLVLAALGPFVLALERRELAGGAKAKTDELFPRKRWFGPLRAVEIDEAIASARLTDRVVSLLGWASIPLGVVAVLGTGFSVAGIRPSDLAGDDARMRRVLETATDIGTYLIGIAALGLAVVGILAYRYDRIRRIIGVIWDLGTFWPRTCHPLSPPCYAERIVPELMVRLIQLTAPESPTAGVVLVGHGQGSVLAAATILQLPTPIRGRVALLTVGSPLRRLYARLFPAYVNDRMLTDLAARLSPADAGLPSGGGPRWINLWRATDPIGGPIGDAAIDRELHDPVGFDFSPELAHNPPIRGHVDFEYDPAFAAAVVELARRLAEVPHGASRN